MITRRDFARLLAAVPPFAVWRSGNATELGHHLAEKPPLDGPLKCGPVIITEPQWLALSDTPSERGRVMIDCLKEHCNQEIGPRDNWRWVVDWNEYMKCYVVEGESPG